MAVTAAAVMAAVVMVEVVMVVATVVAVTAAAVVMVVVVDGSHRARCTPAEHGASAEVVRRRERWR